MGVSTFNLVMPTGTLAADDSVQTGFDWKYTNDMLERLTQAQAGTLSGGSITSETRKQIFDLDQVGNWTHSDLVTGGSTTEFDWDFTHNKVNEITGWDNQTNNVAPTYDAAGNLTDDKRDWKYEYDAWYRLVRVKDQSNNVKAEFVHNALGYRLSARYDESNPWQHFAYDERWRIVAMYEDDADASEPTEQFCYHNAGASGLGGSSYIDDVVLRDRDTDGNGTLDERCYYLQNQHHDVVALVNTSGSISERVNYDPYGSPIGTFTSIANRKGYAGYEYDAELGDTYHVRHRVYRSDLGVWTRRDPLGYVDGLSLYEYVRSRPVMLTDPFGAAQWFNGTSIRDQCDPLLECEHVMACTDCGSRQPHDPPEPLIDAGGAPDSQDYAEIRCRQLDKTIFIPQHCYIRCCKGGRSGTCNTYSLLNTEGLACRLKNDDREKKDNGRPKGLRYRHRSGRNLCDCFERAFTRNQGGECPHKYFANNCNSNWYVNSMWGCCTGQTAGAPITAPFGMWWDCYPCGNGFENQRGRCPFECDFFFGSNQLPPGWDLRYCRACQS